MFQGPSLRFWWWYRWGSGCRVFKCRPTNLGHADCRFMALYGMYVADCTVLVLLSRWQHYQQRFVLPDCFQLMPCCCECGSVDCCFAVQFYGYLSQQQNMMQDYIRTSTYQRAMLENAVDFQDKVSNCAAVFLSSCFYYCCCMLC